MNFANRALGKHSRARFHFWRAMAIGGRRFTRRSGSLVVLALLSCGGLVTGCFRHEHSADVTIINGNEPESLDRDIVTCVSELRLVKALFDGLIKLDPTNATPVPALAASWNISPDGRTYTF